MTKVRKKLIEVSIPLEAINAAARDGWKFEVRTGPLLKLDEDRLKKGTKSDKGQAFVCILTGSAIDRSYIQAEGKADRLGQRLMAIIAEGSRGRLYTIPTDEHEEIAFSVSADPLVAEARATFLSASTPTRAMITGGVCSAYGLRTWGHLFTPRQIVGLTTFADLVEKARFRILADALAAGREDEGATLRDGGIGARAYADAVGTYLGLAVSRQVNRGCTLNFWDNTRENIQQVFGRQAFAMTWDFVETNFFSNSSGNFMDQLELPAKTITNWPHNSASGSIYMIDAAKNNFPVKNIVVSTDPPYYDNIGYATLADFFYVWLKLSLGTIWPDLFRRLATPKDEELVATPYRHGGKAEAEAFFMKGMSDALTAVRNAAIEAAPLAIYYAFKQSESSNEGVSSAGWASFLQGVVDAGLGIDGTWPVRTELTGNLKNKFNVLASSIVLVCTKRSLSAAVTTRADFI